MNNINDRGIKKWQPFDSLESGNKIKHEITKSKTKLKLPTLSEDQLYNIEQKIKEAYYSKEEIQISYFFNGNIIKKVNKIFYIDYQKKQIILHDKTKIYYKQIIKVEII